MCCLPPALLTCADQQHCIAYTRTQNQTHTILTHTPHTQAPAELTSEGFYLPSTKSKTAALIGGIVAGVVGGLALLAGIIAYAIVKKRRALAATEAAYAAKKAAGGSGAAVPAAAGGAGSVTTTGGAVDITAGARGASSGV